MIKLYSWNVNGLRAQEKKGFIPLMQELDADLIGLQETKANQDQLSQELLNIKGYQSHFNSGQRKGYSGVAIYTKLSPLKIHQHFDQPLLNQEGRVIAAEFDNFFIYNVYFPNGGQGPERLKYKLDFYDQFYQHIKSLPKSLILMGDVNTAHQEIDLARPAQNHNTSGFMDIERRWVDLITQNGYIDTFRHFHPDEPNRYTWWDMKTRSRDKNVGWRIDYIFVSSDLKSKLLSAEIHDQILGSDHAPISLTIDL